MAIELDPRAAKRVKSIDETMARKRALTQVRIRPETRLLADEARAEGETLAGLIHRLIMREAANRRRLRFQTTAKD